MKISIGEKVHLNIVQLIAFSLGLLLILGMIGYLSYQVFKLGEKPPQLQVQAEYQADLDDYTYKVKVTNKGDETASNTNLKMTLYQDGKAQESGTFTIAYIPVQSEQLGWITFHTKRKPSDSLVVSSITYLRP